MAQNYNDTIHKMQTPFEMRAGLPKKEPKMLASRSTSCTTAPRMQTAISIWVLP